MQKETSNQHLMARFASIDDRRPIPAWLVYSSLFCVLIAIYIKLWTPISLNRWPEIFYTLTFFYGLYRERAWLARHPMVLGFLAAIVATPLLFLVNYLQDPVRAVEYAHFEKLIRVYLFLPLGYWLSFNRHYLYPFLFLAFFGLVTAAVLDGDMRLFEAPLGSQRLDFGLKNAQHLALWSGLFLLACLSFLTVLQNDFSTRTKAIITVLICLAGLICLIGLYISQTRAIFLGLVASFGLFALTKLIQLRGRTRFITGAAIFFVMVLLSCFFLFTDNAIKKRFQSEQHVLQAVISLDFDNIPNSSIGVRIKSWMTASQWIAKKPLVGWGGDVREQVIDSVPGFGDRERQIFGHLHNTPLEFLVAYGLIGSVIAFAPIAWVFYASNRRRSPTELFAFLAVPFFVVVSLFESYLFFWPGVYTLSLFAAPVLALSMIDANKRKTPIANALDAL